MWAEYPGSRAGHLGEPTHAHPMVVAAGEDAGASRRAERGDVEPVVPEPLAGYPVDVGRVQVGSEASELRKAQIVQDDQHHVRPARLFGHDRRGRAHAAA